MKFKIGDHVQVYNIPYYFDPELVSANGKSGRIVGAYEVDTRVYYYSISGVLEHNRRFSEEWLRPCYVLMLKEYYEV